MLAVRREEAKTLALGSSQITHDCNVHCEHAAEIHEQELTFRAGQFALVQHVVAGKTAFARLLPRGSAAEERVVGQLSTRVDGTEEHFFAVRASVGTKDEIAGLRQDDARAPVDRDVSSGACLRICEERPEDGAAGQNVTLLKSRPLDDGIPRILRGSTGFRHASVARIRPALEWLRTALNEADLDDLRLSRRRINAKIPVQQLVLKGREYIGRGIGLLHFSRHASRTCDGWTINFHPQRFVHGAFDVKGQRGFTPSVSQMGFDSGLATPTMTGDLDPHFL